MIVVENCQIECFRVIYEAKISIHEGRAVLSCQGTRECVDAMDAMWRWMVLLALEAVVIMTVAGVLNRHAMPLILQCINMLTMRLKQCLEEMLRVLHPKGNLALEPSMSLVCRILISGALEERNHLPFSLNWIFGERGSSFFLT